LEEHLLISLDIQKIDRQLPLFGFRANIRLSFVIVQGMLRGSMTTRTRRDAPDLIVRASKYKGRVKLSKRKERFENSVLKELEGEM
jgi:hypothetical protein